MRDIEILREELKSAFVNSNFMKNIPKNIKYIDINLSSSLEGKTHSFNRCITCYAEHERFSTGEGPLVEISSKLSRNEIYKLMKNLLLEYFPNFVVVLDTDMMLIDDEPVYESTDYEEIDKEGTFRDFYITGYNYEYLVSLSDFFSKKGWRSTISLDKVALCDLYERNAYYLPIDDPEEMKKVPFKIRKVLAGYLSHREVDAKVILENIDKIRGII